ncbi:hypothetical protein Peur_059693 [Populus x canadensis]
MGPRWKGKGAEAKALADPMSEIVSRLQSSLLQSNARASLSGCSVLLAVETEQTELLTRACFGKPIITAEKDKQWFQLGLEEAPGLQYGVDFVAYRHHPSLLHSEYAVIVLSEGDVGRLRVWSDFNCTIRLCGSVAKTLLVLNVDRNGHGALAPSCLERCSIEECTITRWSPEQSRDDQKASENGTNIQGRRRWSKEEIDCAIESLKSSGVIEKCFTLPVLF